MYKLIAIDMDGTLLNDRHEVPEDVKYTLSEAKKQGIKIVLCSGRPIGGIRSYIKALNLNQEGDFAIAYNGALVQDTHTNEVVAELSLGHADLVKLYELSMELKTPMHFFDTKGVYTPNADISDYTVLEAYLSEIPLGYRQVSDIPTNISIPKIMFVNHPDKLNRTIEELPKSLNKQYTIVQSAPYFLEFVHPSASKGNAVKMLAEQLGIKQEETMTIGDNGNDLSMIRYAGCGVAMGNAIPEVKAAADFQTRSNNESGVAYAIKKLALEPLNENAK
ncbi:sugar-phosphatase [Bacilli bacterium]|uniref:sugar-phosphatase n=1 Tax=Oceanobacillus TaxID=182709 RepID=UPI00062282C9|nr:sugar-phosphatase [Oceanobacillus caeni]KKE80426.1 sugar phosphatase [Bacilli bacterium VT-13-104]PZD82977.1 Cof-type HAD-IIB family hydrolase [Bacilli bacterium]MBU8792051.1 sugar-phosphatase [Oceanobacillus caeni]PZD83692.1 Cof-type HAD-IIB family hydrolase [Bacilli bacterium]PZD85488.1 Cof-type HAD-IIB family hydrolase [Bacilli bacterium]